MHNSETLSDQAVVAPPTVSKVILEVTKRALGRVCGKASGIWPRRPGTEVIGFQDLKSQSLWFRPHTRDIGKCSPQVC